MIDTATHHVYVDGPTAAIDFLADAELAIRDPAHEIGYAMAYELIYQAYNWLQFRALLPDARNELLDLVKQLRQALAENDQEFIDATLTELEDIVEGQRSPPDVGV